MGLKEEKLYTVEEFEKLDEEGYYFEYHNGRVFSMTAPNLQHQLISNEIATELTIYLRGKPCKIYPNVNVRFEINSETIIVIPDLVLICDKKDSDTLYYNGVPKFIVEILSPSNKWHDTDRKKEWYRKVGVEEYWIVDGRLGIITVFLFQKEEAYTYSFNDVVPISVFNGEFSLDFSKLDLT